MLEQTRSPLKIKGLATPLLRPLPTILTYVNLAANAGHGGHTVGRQLFTVHLRAFKAMLIALTRSASMPDKAIRPLLNRCRDLDQAGFWDLRNILEAFLEELQSLQQANSQPMKEAAKEQKEQLGQLFRSETGPSRLVAVHNDQTWPQAEKLHGKLVDGCWYECESRHENEGTCWLSSADLVLLVSGELPIRKDLEKAVKRAQVPMLVLSEAGQGKEMKTMAALRTEHLYQQNGHRVLRGPFAPIRLYQAIDACLVRHMLGQESVLHKMEAVTT